jgi:hypothetical protein
LRRINPISRSAKPFCQGEAGAVGLTDTHGKQSTCNHGAIDSIRIANEVSWGITPWKCLRYLMRNPFTGRSTLVQGHQTIAVVAFHAEANSACLLAD